MPKKTLKAETVLKLGSPEELVKMSAMKLDFHLAASPETEQAQESSNPRPASAKVVATHEREQVQGSRNPRPAPAKVVAKVGSVNVKVGKS